MIGKEKKKVKKNPLKTAFKWTVGLLVLAVAGRAVWEALDDGNLLGYRFKGE